MRHLAHFEWLTVCHMSGADLVKQGEPSGAHVDMWHLLIGWKIQSGWIRKSNELIVDPQFCPSTLAFILWVSHSPIVLI